MIQIVGISTRDTVLRAFGKRRFKSHNGLGGRRSLIGAVAEQSEHLAEMRYILLADLHRLRIGAEIVIAIRQAETALIEPRDHQLGILVIGSRVEVEQA